MDQPTAGLWKWCILAGILSGSSDIEKSNNTSKQQAHPSAALRYGHDPETKAQVIDQ